MSLGSPALAGGFFTTAPPEKLPTTDEAFIKSWGKVSSENALHERVVELCFHVTTQMSDRNVFVCTHNLVSQRMSWGRHLTGGRLRRDPRCKLA